jgi:MFS family permease
MGLALGCDYPTAHLIISESIPTSTRGRLVLGAFGFQAVGALVGTFVGFIILSTYESQAAWRVMYFTAVLPAVAVTAGRFFIPGSSHWLVSNGRMEEAERETERLLRRLPPYPKTVKLKLPRHHHHHGHKKRPGFLSLFSKENRSATILASVPWFLQDLGTYGIGIFTPTILASMVGKKTEHARSLSEVIHAEIEAAEGAMLIDALLIIGIVGAVLLADKVGRIRLQMYGFVGCAVGLFLASLSVYTSGTAELVLVFAGFMVFNFMTNLGPNAMTYLLAGEVFPTHIRGTGAGFAASFAKVGAVLTSFLFPILLVQIGTATLLYLLVGTSLLGAAVTWYYGIETAGVSLEAVGAGAEGEAADAPPAGAEPAPVVAAR